MLRLVLGIVVLTLSTNIRSFDAYAVEETPSIFTEGRCFGNFKFPPKPPTMSFGGGEFWNPGDPRIPSPPAECARAAVNPTVSPGNFSSALNNLNSGEKIVLSPGAYPPLNLSGRSFGGATIQCAEPGACQFGNSTLRNVSGLTIDGIIIRGGNSGIIIRDSQSITVRCSTLHEQTGDGITTLGDSTDQIKIHNNVFFNGKTGCHPTIKTMCGTMPDGSVIASMDYGLRLYDVKNIDIAGNQFTGNGGKGIFNHCISLKEKVGNAIITNNNFDYCGRNCIEPGQEPNTNLQPNISCGQAVITGNTFNNVRSTVLWVKNVRRVIYQDNTFNNVSGNRLRVDTNIRAARGGQIINGGFPPGRAVIGTGP